MGLEERGVWIYEQHTVWKELKYCVKVNIYYIYLLYIRKKEKKKVP